jgi:hypothetical protein
MREFVEDVVGRYELVLERVGEASVIKVPKQHDLIFEVTIPDDVLEWFVVAFSGASVVWEDWCDYYPLEKDVEERLAAEMRTDVERFVAALVEGEFRVDNGRVERLAVGSWSQFEIAATT